MTRDADTDALEKFSSKKGEAYRMVLAHKDDITRWIEEGWAIVAIYRLLRSKGIIRAKYGAFRRAVLKAIPSNPADKQNSAKSSPASSTEQGCGKKQNAAQRQRPHEVQRNKQQQFVTISGVDHIGLDKKEE